MADVIHIGCQADHRFTPDCAVMLHSLLSNNPDEVFDVHFLFGDDLPQEDRQGLRSIVERLGSRWSPILVTTDHTAGFPSMPRYGGLTAWYRLLLPRLLDTCERVLYLDADLLVLDAVRPLWEVDLGSAKVAAVTNPTLKGDRHRVINDLGLASPDDYFNSGVMLLDLEGLRTSGLMDDVERFVRDRRSPMPWADQEPLNAVLARHRLHLHPRWNVMNPCYDLPARLLPWSEVEIAHAIANPAIIHFIGPYKAWHHRLRHPHQSAWFRHLADTPWTDRPIEGRTLRHRMLRPLPPRWAVSVETAEAKLRKLSVNRGLRRIAGMLPASQLRALRRARALLSATFGLSPAPRLLADVLQVFADTTDRVCFVQIGSNDATHGDPLRDLSLRRKWRGVLVEPVPYVFERLRAAVAGVDHLVPENAAISHEDGTQDFHYLAESTDPNLPEWYDQLGSFSLDTVLHPYHLERIPDLADRVVTAPVRCMTFDTLWRKHDLPQLDLLHVDAEGYDDEILKLVDLEALRPRIVLYESKHLDDARRRATAHRLSSCGYQLMEVGPDTLALRGSGAPLALRLMWRRQVARAENYTPGRVASDVSSEREVT